MTAHAKVNAHTRRIRVRMRRVSLTIDDGGAIAVREKE
jgi:hypothetical protein